MPATPTPRLKLPLPSQTDPADVPTDLSKLATALDSGGSGGVGAGVAVSGQGVASARPAAGVQGRLWWSTDAKVLFYDDGTAWQQLSPDTTAPHLIGYVEKTTQQTGIATSMTLISGLALPTRSYDGTRYAMVSAMVNFNKASADSATWISLRIIDGTATAVMDGNVYCSAPGYTSLQMSRLVIPNGSKTFQVQAMTNAGFVNVSTASLPSWLKVDDLGPVAP